MNENNGDESRITEFMLSNALSEYQRISCYRNTRAVVTRKGFVDIRLEKSEYQGLTVEGAYNIIRRQIKRMKKKKNPRYGMTEKSRAAVIEAYKKGLKPASRFQSPELHSYGFNYPVRFFRWVVQNFRIGAQEYHYTSVANNRTAFYSRRAVDYMVREYDLDFLLRIYKAGWNAETTYKKRGIRYAKVRIVGSLPMLCPDNHVIALCFLYEDMLIFNRKFVMRENDERVSIMRIWEMVPVEIMNIEQFEVLEEIIKYRREHFTELINSK